MTPKERHQAAVDTLRALRDVCEHYPEKSGCRRCPLNEWCGTRAPDSISDEEVEQIAAIAEKEMRRC